MRLDQGARLVGGMLACATSPAAFAQGFATPVTETTSSSVGINDIVVSASRFSESIQRSASLISVIGADELAGISDVRQLQTIDPGIQLGVGGGVTQTFIRGVGSFNLQNTQEGRSHSIIFKDTKNDIAIRTH